jgi:hypothetical protein
LEILARKIREADDTHVEYSDAIHDIFIFLVEFTPYGVSFVALAGTLMANRMTGKNMIMAEQERARLAEIAEDKRAALMIAAQDRQAADAIKAENLRHDNEMRRASRSHLLDRIRDLYVELERVRRELSEASWRASEPYDGPDLWKSESSDAVKEFRVAIEKYERIHDTVALLGSRSMGVKSREVLSAALSALFQGDTLLVDDLDRPYAEFKALKDLHRSLRRNCDSLLEEMRTELHPDDGAVEPL